MNFKESMKKILLPITLAGSILIPNIANAEEISLSTGVSSKGKIGLNLGIERLIEKDGFLSPYVALELSPGTIDLGGGLKPTEADNFCPYLGGGLSFQPSNPMFRTSVYLEAGIQRFFVDGDKSVFFEYERNFTPHEPNYGEGGVNEEEFNHKNQYKLGVRIPF
jgi:hypothetical protein